MGTFSKIIEKAAHMQLREYQNKTFENKHQFAYKKAHSTPHPIILTRHVIEKHLKNKKYALLIMIDLSLAFDCIETSSILPDKLKHYGADPNTNSFFKNFFTNRQHLTEWFGATSEILNLSNYSCVQGSCLGAPMFNVYTNDLLTSNSKNSTIIAYADDTNIIVSGNNLREPIETANKELEKISAYMSSNSLLINPQKQKKNSHDLPKKLMLNNSEIEITENANYLGIILDKNLNFKPQFNSLHKKLTNATRALLTSRKFLNTPSKLLIYNSLFKSNLEYAAVAYFDKLTITQIEKLTKLQKQALCFVFQTKPKVHTKKLFEATKIIPI